MKVARPSCHTAAKLERKEEGLVATVGNSRR
jgi:hypothetical protein